MSQNTKHAVRIDLDTDGNLTVTHRCVVKLGNHEISHSEPVELDNAKEIALNLAALIDSNREAVEAAATKLAINHVAAVNNVKQPGVKRITLKGSLKPAADSKTTKN